MEEGTDTKSFVVGKRYQFEVEHIGAITGTVSAFGWRTVSLTDVSTTKGKVMEKLVFNRNYIIYHIQLD